MESAVGVWRPPRGAKKSSNASTCAFDGPAHGLALNLVISGQFGAAHKKDSNPRIKSSAWNTLPTILPTPPRTSLTVSYTHLRAHET